MTAAALAIGCGLLGLALGPVLFAVIDHHVTRAVTAFADHPRTSSRVRSLQSRPLADSRRPGNLATRGRPTRAKRLVVAGTGIHCACTGAYLGPVWHLPAYLYLTAAGLAVTLIDLQVKRLLDGIVLPSYVIGGLLLGAGVAHRRRSGVAGASRGRRRGHVRDLRHDGPALSGRDGLG